jgi:hypothetical protein
MKVTLSILCALASAAAPLGASEPLALRVNPNVAMAPATVRVVAMIEPDAQNRLVEIVAESDNFYRSSQLQLEGAHARRTSLIELRSLPPGAYEVRATLKGPGDVTRAVTRQHVQVMGEGRWPGEPASGQQPSAEPR